jgi:hypothetical protein
MATSKMEIHALIMMIVKIWYVFKIYVESYLINSRILIATMLPDKMEISANFLKIAPLDIVFLIIAMET